MKVAVFSTKPYDRTFFTAANQSSHHELVFFQPHLSMETVSLAAGFEAVCVFVNDTVSAEVLGALKNLGVRLVALRCAGFNNVDLETARTLGITVVRVPAYSPYAVAEHTVGLMMALNRKLHRAYNRIREGNFALDGLMGFDMHGKTVGIIGTGKIGRVTAGILKGFGCRVLAYDLYPNPDYASELGFSYVSFDDLLKASDIVSLHCPLTPQTRHLIDAAAIAKMKDGVMLINTSRGAIMDARALIQGLKSGKIGHLGLDVYEEEADLFFEDLSCQIIQDDIFMRLLTFPNVLITGHQAFFTQEAVNNIVDVTLANITEFERDQQCQNDVLKSLV